MVNLRRTRAALLLALALASTTRAWADPSPGAQTEIDHLPAFVGASPCTFVRNGEPHPAKEARDHLAGKFNYAKGRVATADDFIRFVATESSMSHEPYKVKCGAAEMLAGAWLGEELRRYRASVARGPNK